MFYDNIEEIEIELDVLAFTKLTDWSCTVLEGRRGVYWGGVTVIVFHRKWHFILVEEIVACLADTVTMTSLQTA